MATEKRLLKVFLCHASADKPKVRDLYRYLRRRGIKPWFDEMDLVGGQDWQVEIPKALSTSDAIIICLTKNSVDKEGYVQKEIKFALDKALEMPEGRIFLIPVRFEECEVPFALSRYQWVDLFDEAGYARMMKALKFRAAQLERATVQVLSPDKKEEKLVSERDQQEKQEREAAEKAAKEEAERKKSEKAAQEKLERDAAEKARRDEAERKATEKAKREKAKREATEKARQERAERLTAQIANLRGSFVKSFNSFRVAISKAKPFFRIGGILGIILILFWIGSSAAPQFLSGQQPAEASATAHPSSTIAPSSLPADFTNTVEPSATVSIETKTPAATALPTEITDAIGMLMVLVPAGEFRMNVQSSDEQNVNVDTIYNVDSFYIDKFEVTNSNYSECVKDQVCPLPQGTTISSVNYYGNSKYDDFPVVWISHSWAYIYCDWRNARLPNETEWVKAARGTDRRIYPWGNSFDGNTIYTNYVGIADGYEFTAPVGSFPLDVSPYGVHDMAGNVAEWVGEEYSPADAPLYKGKAWYAGHLIYYVPEFAKNDLQIDDLARSYPTSSSSYIGFRCVKDVNPLPRP